MQQKYKPSAVELKIMFFSENNLKKVLNLMILSDTQGCNNITGARVTRNKR
jgi:hypothetical protein